MTSHAAPHTFATRKDANDWLATVRADMVRGTWRDPGEGAISLADYVASHLATRLDLAPAPARTTQAFSPTGSAGR